MQEKIEQLVQQNWGQNFIIHQVIRNGEKKLIEFEDEHNVIYIAKGEKADKQSFEQNCEFAQKLRNILPFPEYLKTNQLDYCVYMDGYVFTFEKKVTEGFEIKVLNDTYLTAIGKHLGRLHQYSLKNQIRLHKATSWSLFGGNATDEIGDYDENELSFLDLKQGFGEEPIFAEIKQQYHAIRTKLQNAWPNLPIAATQGDFCFYNMRFNATDLVGLFDFNIAGDEVLLNESIAVGVYHAWHVPYEGSLTGHERFAKFIEAYSSQRHFTEDEMILFPILTRLIRAFRFDRVEEGLSDKLNKNAFLEETKAILLGQQ